MESKNDSHGEDIGEDSPRTDREMIEVESPAYFVTTPCHIPDLVFGPEGYESAFNWATGLHTNEAGDQTPEEDRITILDFDGTIDVPIAEI